MPNPELTTEQRAGLYSNFVYGDMISIGLYNGFLTGVVPRFDLQPEDKTATIVVAELQRTYHHLYESLRVLEVAEHAMRGYASNHYARSVLRYWREGHLNGGEHAVLRATNPFLGKKGYRIFEQLSRSEMVQPEVVIGGLVLAEHIRSELAHATKTIETSAA